MSTLATQPESREERACDLPQCWGPYSNGRSAPRARGGESTSRGASGSCRNLAQPGACPQWCFALEQDWDVARIDPAPGSSLTPQQGMAGALGVHLPWASELVANYLVFSWLMNSWSHCIFLRAGVRRVDHTVCLPRAKDVPVLAGFGGAVSGFARGGSSRTSTRGVRRISAEPPRRHEAGRSISPKGKHEKTRANKLQGGGKKSTKMNVADGR